MTGNLLLVTALAICLPVKPLGPVDLGEALPFAQAEVDRLGLIEEPLELDVDGPTLTGVGWTFSDHGKGVSVRVQRWASGLAVSTIGMSPGEQTWLPFAPEDDPTDQIATLEDLASWAEVYREKLKLDEEWHDGKPDLRGSVFRLQDDGTTKRQIGKAEIIFERNPGGFPVLSGMPERKTIILDPYDGRFLVYRHLAHSIHDASTVRLGSDEAAGFALWYATQRQLPWPESVPAPQGPGYAYDAASFDRMRAAWRGLNGDRDPAAAGLPPDADDFAWRTAAFGPQPYGVLTLVYVIPVPGHALYVSASTGEVWEPFEVSIEQLFPTAPSSGPPPRKP